MKFEIIGFDYDAQFDETVVTVDAWYDRHTRLWVVQKLNKDGYQVGDADYVYGKADAMRVKKETEKDYNI